MKSEEVKLLTHKAIEELTAALNAGRTEELTRYLVAMSRFHRYSIHNVMLITLQRAVTYCFTSLESMNIGGCASMETRDGRLVTVRTNLICLVDLKQSTRD